MAARGIGQRYRLQWFKVRQIDRDLIFRPTGLCPLYDRRMVRGRVMENKLMEDLGYLAD
jgi:hypothetical protein